MLGVTLHNRTALTVGTLSAQILTVLRLDAFMEVTT